MFQQLVPFFLFVLALWYNRVTIAQVDGAEPRIINGENSTEGRWPFMVSILFDLSKDGSEPVLMPYCGGTILNDDTILTAAHCIKDKTRLNGTVVYAGHVKNTNHDSKFLYKAAKFISHPNYSSDLNTTGNHNDVAVIKLARKIDFKELKGKVAKVCLPSKDDAPLVDKCIGIGWGKTSMKEDKFVRTLQQATLPIVAEEQCDKQTPGYDKEGFYCAGYADGHKGICIGDSGGPLVCPSKSDPNVFIQYGITSFGEEGCVAFGFFTKTAPHVTWIAQNAEN